MPKMTDEARVKPPMSAAAAGGRSVHENVRPVEPGQPSSRIALMPAARVAKEKKITAGTPRRSTARRSAGRDMPLLYVIPLSARFGRSARLPT